MSTIGKRVIYVGPADGANHKPLNTEGVATEADILPGMAVEQITTSGLRKNATAATQWSHILLVADKDQQRTKSVDDVWVQNENMVAIQPRSGEFVNLLVQDGNNILQRNAPITVDSTNPGKFKIAVTPGTIGATSEQVLAYADEVINVSGADALVCCRVA